MFNVPKRSWSILLQTVKGASRSVFVCSGLWILASSTSPAQQNGIDQDSEIIIVPGGENILRWHGHAGRSYFVQVSDTNDPLRKWKWAPIIDAADNADISHQVGATADKAFFRLKYTNQIPGPGETLDTADFDQDGISNLDEIVPQPPLLATDPLDPDTDHDGLTDGWERSFSAQMLALGAPQEHWGSNLPSLQSGNLDPQATLQNDGMTIQEIYNFSNPVDYQMILYDLFIQAKRAQFGFAVSHDSITTEEGGPPVNQGGGGFVQGSGFGDGSIETWSRSIFSGHVLDVQLDPFSVTPDTSLAWFNNESQYITWTYHTHWIEAFDPNPRTLFPIKEMANSSYTFMLTNGGRSDYSQFHATGPFVSGQPTDATRWSGETYKSKFRLYRPRPTNTPLSHSFLKVTTERQLELNAWGNVVWSSTPPTTTVEAIQATIPAFGHTSPWIETTPQATAQKSRSVDLVAVEVVDKDGVTLTELKVGKMYPDVFTGTGLPGSPVSVNLDADEDRFFVRAKGADSLGIIKMKFETVDNPDTLYNDDPTEYTLESKDGYATTKSMVLVSDDVDDHHLSSYSPANPDNSPDDRTHKIQLGGDFKISAIKVGLADWVATDINLPVKKKKTVRVQFVNCTYGVWDLDPCWTTPQIVRVKKHLQERYAQAGIEFDFQPTLAGANVDSDGEMTDSEVPSFDGSVGKIYFPQETKDLIDHGPPNDLHNTLMIYLVNKLGDYGGIATPPKYVETVNVRFHNKILLANEDLRDFTAGHEAIHVLCDAAHAPPSYNDFSTERGDPHTLWSQPLITPFYSEMDRRDNISVGSTKRISIAQEAAAHSSPLAK